MIARLLESGPQVLATGGGAFMNADTRALIGHKGISVWLKRRLRGPDAAHKRRNDRPLLDNDDPAETLRRLIEERYPIYGQADVTVHSRDVPHDTIVDEIIARSVARIGACNAEPAGRRDDERAAALWRPDRRQCRARHRAL